MTEALIKPIRLIGKDCSKLIEEAFSEENRKRVEHFNKYERPKLKSAPNRTNKMSIDELMKAYE